MIIKLEKKKRRVGGVKVKKRFLILPVIHKRTFYWLESVKLHYTWNGKNWVMIDILKNKNFAKVH